MKLSQTLHNVFNPRDRQQGAYYYNADHVLSLQHDQDGSFIADVMGNEGDYTVIVKVLDGRVSRFDCTCPRHMDGYNCKHLWATILAIDELNILDATPASRRNRKTTKLKRPTKQQPPRWQKLLQSLESSRYQASQPARPTLESIRQTPTRIHYVIDVSARSRYDGDRSTIELRLVQQMLKKNGDWGRATKLSLDRTEIANLACDEDRTILQSMVGVTPKTVPLYGSYARQFDSYSQFEITPAWSVELLERLQATQRFYWTLGMELDIDEFQPVNVDFRDPFSISVEVIDLPDHDTSVMNVCLRREGHFIPESAILELATNGVALTADRLIRIDNPEARSFLTAFRNAGPIKIDKKHREEFIKKLASIQGLPDVRVPDAWSIEQLSVKPLGKLSLRPNQNNNHELLANVAFRYGDAEVAWNDSRTSLYDDKLRRWIRRDATGENEVLAQLTAFPFQEKAYYGATFDLTILSRHFRPLVSALAEQGWCVLWIGRPLKPPGVFNITVNSGSDWFDLDATIDYDGETIALPALLAALQKNEAFITLADGSQGQLPQELLEKYAKFAEFGEVHDDSIRFRPTQAMLLDALLQSQEHVVFDRKFQQYKKKLQSFTGVQPKDAPRGFQGALREYQKEGLGWLHFLQEFGLGGCLADDMGLGKTIQVLSLLEARRIRRTPKSPANGATADQGPRPSKNGATPKKAKKSVRGELLKNVLSTAPRKPSIVIVPKSLVFNWIDEAAKFTPKLRILNYTGTDRTQRVEESDGFDVLITTYGTMRKDIVDLSSIAFDYAILDESQAIKNSAALAAKASRLLVADHRLAMTGTPIENHLGELWSLFEFLNPGMLGRSKAFAALTKQRTNAADDSTAIQAVAQGLRPFMLRRTKDQVLKDLPEKSEQTLYCDMLPAQRKQYNELKEYYRVKLAKNIETKGMKRSKIQVLEALLRLRQVACDPRLLDASAKPGAKLELLQEQLEEVVSEGHKILVFSQFTSLLGLVREHMDAAGIPYEYLDGKTTKRAEKVKRFQEDKEVPMFLISLKAGGHGLNLTAADYVYLLDPWWNPAVEAQAIDRAHRMGQKRSVMAYRIICRDTVEEKIVTLQQTKRELAESIISADESLIRTMTTDDLQLLLG